LSENDPGLVALGIFWSAERIERSDGFHRKSGDLAGGVRGRSVGDGVVGDGREGPGASANGAAGDGVERGGIALSWVQGSEFNGAPGYGLDSVEGGGRLLVDITEGFEVARLRGLLRGVDGVGVGSGEDETEKKDRDCAQCPETQNQRRKKRSNVAKER